jgi:spore maturation protein CgeB
VSHPLDIVFLGLCITSSWGNGHATTYRGLVRELTRRGHRVLFLERDRPWYAENRDLAQSPWGRVELYQTLDELKDRFEPEIRRAALVVVGSYVPEGVAVGTWVVARARGLTAFYDIDTPVTLERLAAGDCDYLSKDLARRYDLYLSFTGGPMLGRIERELGAKRALPLYCGVDVNQYLPEARETSWDLGYLGTYSEDRQPIVDRLLIEPARRWRAGRFVVAGPQYPRNIRWPQNVSRVQHLAPPKHAGFYSAQRFALNATRQDMARAGWSPSVRLFEAAACATPVISDGWAGLEEFFAPGREILVARSTEEILAFVREMPEAERRRVGEAARARVLRQHTAGHRAQALEEYVS